MRPLPLGCSALADGCDPSVALSWVWCSSMLGGGVMLDSIIIAILFVGLLYGFTVLAFYLGGRFGRRR
jgi:hypothetical protein